MTDAATHVRARLAHAVLPRLRLPRTLGAFRLRPDQVDACGRLQAALAEFGGTILADPPGTGKTIVALAVAAASARPVVCAPAAVRDVWARAMARAGVAWPVVSLEAISRGAHIPPATLLIIDEAHQVRTPGTARYVRIAAAAVGTPLLLLTATPVVNTVADRTALLALFLGARATALSAETLGRCLVRRTGLLVGRPAVRRLPPLRAAADVPGLADALAALPPPLPVASTAPRGGSATALVITSLAMAWRSSLAALDDALRRRVQMGEALCDLLAAGQIPSRSALSAWVLDETATQLAFGALLHAEGHGGGAPVDSASGRRLAIDDARATVDRHLEAVRRLRARVAPYVPRDTAARVAALLALRDRHPADRMVVFARSRVTIRALYASLRGEPGVVAMTGSGVRSAAGRWTRTDVLRAVGPGAAPWRRDDPRQVRLLLTSDALSEGVEMPGVRVLVHADLPWTPARLEQRQGRVRRAGSVAGVALETRFEAPRGADRLIRLVRRLRRKAHARRTAVAASDATSAIRARLGAWAAASGEGARVAAVRGSAPGFIAALRDAAGAVTLCIGRRRAGGWVVSRRPAAILQALEAAEGDTVSVPARLLREVRRVLARHAMRGRAQVAIDGTTEASGPCGATDAMLIARLRRRLTRILATTPPLARPATAAAHSRWLAALTHRIEAGRAAQLRSLLSIAEDRALHDGLGALLTHRGTEASAPPPGRPMPRPPARPPALVALLLVSPGASPTSSRASRRPRGARRRAPRRDGPRTVAPR